MLWVLLGCLAIYLVFWLTDFDRQRRKLPRLIEEAKALGMPVTVEEFGQVLAVSDDQNAAPIYREIAKEFDALAKEKPEIAELLKSKEFDPSSVEVQQAVAATEMIDNLTRRAAELPACRINRLAESAGQDVAEIQALRLAIKQSLFRVRRSVLLDRPDEAFERLEWMLNLIPHSLMEPSNLAVVTSIGNSTLWMEGLNSVVRRHHAKPGVLDRAEALLDRLPALPPFKIGSQGEVAFALAFGEKMTEKTIDEYFPNGTPFPLSHSYFRSKRAIEAYISYAVESSIAAYRKIPENPDDWIGVGQALQPHSFMRDWWRRPSYSMNLWYRNNAEVIPVHITRERMSRLGIQLYREFARNGAFPAQLPVTETARDARSGRPFTYVAMANGFSLQAQRIVY